MENSIAFCSVSLVVGAPESAQIFKIFNTCFSVPYLQHSWLLLVGSCLTGFLQVIYTHAYSRRSCPHVPLIERRKRHFSFHPPFVFIALFLVFRPHHFSKRSDLFGHTAVMSPSLPVPLATSSLITTLVAVVWDQASSTICQALASCVYSEQKRWCCGPQLMFPGGPFSRSSPPPQWYHGVSLFFTGEA